MKRSNILYHKIIGFVFLYFLTGASLFAQDDTQDEGRSEKMENYTLEQCIEFALEHSADVANARLSNLSDNAKVGEVRAQGLPQANINLDLIDNYKIQTSFIPAILFDPNAAPDEFAPVEFSTKYNGTLGLSVSQLLFDGSFFLGLKAAKTFTELSEKQITQSEIQTKEAVTKAFYGVLITQEKLKLLNQNDKQLDTLLYQTNEMYKNGFVEQLDVTRIEVSSNNLKAQKMNIQRVLDLSIGLLNELFKEKWSENLDGGLLESFGRLFKHKVGLYVYPWKNRKDGEIVTAETFKTSEKVKCLYQYFLQNKMIHSVASGDVELLNYTGREIKKMIFEGGEEWKAFVPDVAHRAAQHSE